MSDFAASGGDLTITVTEPAMNNDAFGSYVSFKVNTKTNRANFSAGEFSVLRRYSDFEWLSSILAHDHPGIIIPAMPEKQTVGRFSPEFVEQRRRGLERFMAKIALHQVLAESRHFIAFLTTDQVAFNVTKSIVKQEKAESKPSAADSMSSWFSRTAVSVANAVQNKQVVVEKSAADLKIDEIAEYVSNLEINMDKASQSSSLLVKRNIQLSQAQQEVSNAFSAFGLGEPDAHGTICAEFGKTTGQLSVTTNEFAERLSIQFEEPLLDFVRLIGSTKAALSRRADKRRDYVNAVTDTESKQASYQKYLAAPDKQDKAAVKLKEVEKAQEEQEKAKRILDEVTTVFLAEFDNFKNNKTAEIKNLLVKLCELDIDYHSRYGKEQTSLLEKVKV